MSGSAYAGSGEARTSVPLEMNSVIVRPEKGLALSVREELSVEFVETESRWN